MEGKEIVIGKYKIVARHSLQCNYFESAFHSKFLSPSPTFVEIKTENDKILTYDFHYLPRELFSAVALACVCLEVV